MVHPQANGQVEVTNIIILNGLKKRLEKALGAWVDELTSVLWAYRTTPRSKTGETPFSLVYGMEAFLPVEVELQSQRSSSYELGQNEESMMAALDTIEELRGQASTGIEAYKQRMRAAHDRKVKIRRFQVGDLVWKRIDMLKHVGKLEPNWEGPYLVEKVHARGAYSLKDAEGQSLARGRRVVACFEHSLGWASGSKSPRLQAGRSLYFEHSLGWANFKTKVHSFLEHPAIGVDEWSLVSNIPWGGQVVEKVFASGQDDRFVSNIPWDGQVSRTKVPARHPHEPNEYREHVGDLGGGLFGIREGKWSSMTQTLLVNLRQCLRTIGQASLRIHFTKRGEYIQLQAKYWDYEGTLQDLN
ncbi:gag-pol polyprotein [Striga asiatica]|uniref:Gag-pol polyprotein n=1 Tax=Striga asiatica TaxID=4170 RepID=A0A5A7R8G2_STRAF|nr:gag-pol polyprotein [Striga asiatica]